MRIKKAVPLENHRLKVTFSTGEEGVFDLSEYLSGPIFSKLKDEDVFTHVAIDEVAGTVFWPNGIDLCPDVVYERTTLSSKNTR